MADGDARARSWTRATVSSVAAIVASAAFVVLATRPSADSTSARLSLAPGDADADAVARSVVDPFCDARSGHLAPSVFLLGVEKCGTSSLFEDMTASLPALRKMHARVGEDVVVSATGTAGKVTAVSGALVTVQAGAMGLKVNASDVIPDPNAAAKAAKAAKPPAKAFAPRGSRAARRWG